MPIRMIWDDNEKTILHHIYEGSITSTEMHAAVDENFEIQKQVKHPVYVITDFTQVTSIGNVLVSMVGQNAEKKVPQNQYMVILVGANLFLKTLLRMAQNVAPLTMKNLKTANTLDDAYQLIEQDRVENNVA
jgi:hypothetical protein